MWREIGVYTGSALLALGSGCATQTTQDYNSIIKQSISLEEMARSQLSSRGRVVPVSDTEVVVQDGYGQTERWGRRNGHFVMKGGNLEKQVELPYEIKDDRIIKLDSGQEIDFQVDLHTADLVYIGDRDGNGIDDVIVGMTINKGETNEEKIFFVAYGRLEDNEIKYTIPEIFELPGVEE